MPAPFLRPSHPQVMPYSMGCATPLSNFEANQNYKDVTDPAGARSLFCQPRCPSAAPHHIGVLRWRAASSHCELPVAGPARGRGPGVDDDAVDAPVQPGPVRAPDVRLRPHHRSEARRARRPCGRRPSRTLADSASALVLTLSDKATGHQYILLEKRLEALYKNPAEGKEYTVQGRMKGEELVGKKYKPLFDYFYEVRTSRLRWWPRRQPASDRIGHWGGGDLRLISQRKKDTAFRIVSDKYVTDDSGTGIVHQAPAFGEDDFRYVLGGTSSAFRPASRAPTPTAAGC